ncbi:MAG: T9SS type A sorting domain-containing protein, partial [Bacteroidales bacterium]
ASQNDVTLCFSLTRTAVTLTINAAPAAPTANNVSVCYDGNVHTASATAPSGSSVVYYDAAIGGNVTVAPSASAVGIYTAYAESVNDVTACVSALRTLVTLEIGAPPTADAGFDQSICEDQTAQLIGSATNYASVLWTGNVSDPTILNPVYTPTPADITAGFAELCLTAEAIDPCTIDATDCVIITIDGLPTVNAGDDATICATGIYSTNPIVENSTQVFWFTNGDGNFDDETALVTDYHPGLGDLAIGSVELCLSIVGEGACGSAVLEDCLILSFDPAPTANAGNDATICEGDTHQLDGAATNYSALEWTTSGDGTFNDETVLNPVYTPGVSDITSGSVSLCLYATGLDACTSEVVNLCMSLTIVAKPVITLPDVITLDCSDITFGRLDTIQLAPVYDPNLVSFVEWSTTNGTGYFIDANVGNAKYVLGDSDIWGTDGFDLCFAANGLASCTYVATKCVNIIAPAQFISHTDLGGDRDWIGISSYVDKSTSTVPQVMAPVVNDLTIMINKAGKYYWPIPSPPVNQLGNWDKIGYKAKMGSFCLPIYGDQLMDQTFQITGPFTYLPTLTNYRVRVANAEGPLAGHVGDDSEPGTKHVKIILNWTNGELWTPGGTNLDPDSLFYLYPGHACLLVTEGAQNFSIDFPDYDPSVRPSTTYMGGATDFEPNITPWNDIQNTGSSHFIMFTDIAKGQFQPGDVIGSFDQSGLCVGMSDALDRNKILYLLAMGDDLTTTEIDGYNEGAAMTFKLYRQSNNEVYDLAFTYDPEYPNYDGTFATYGVSQVVGMTMSITTINEANNNSNVQVFPNPAKDVINVVSGINVKSLTLVNYVGQKVYNQSVNGNNFQINVSDFSTGMYIVRIETTDGSIITKRITIE